MRSYFKLLTITATLLACSSIFAAEPIINNNVTIMQNTDAAHCPASWEGETGNDMVTGMSGYGMDTGIATAGIESCTGCAYDVKSHNCVCKTCYGYYN